MRRRSSPCLTQAAIFTTSAAVTCIFFINFCALVFRCGCRSLWAGADAHCNIHSPGVHHCPWCASVSAQAIVFLAIVAAQFAVAFRPAGQPWPLRLLLTVAAFPAAGALIAAASGILAGYWR